MMPILTIACMIVATLGFVPTRADAVERIYFIAADEVVWDFAPSDPNNPITGEPFTKEELVFLRHAKDRIGRKYLKAVYREYTMPPWLLQIDSKRSNQKATRGLAREGRPHLQSI